MKQVHSCPEDGQVVIQFVSGIAYCLGLDFGDCFEISYGLVKIGSCALKSFQHLFLCHSSPFQAKRKKLLQFSTLL